MPEIVKREISSPKLKDTQDETVLEMFSNIIVLFFMPKTNSDQEFELIKLMIKQFASICELTLNEFQTALGMVAKGTLKFYEEDKDCFRSIQIFHQVSIPKLGEIEQAYIYYKRNNANYERGRAMIKDFFQPKRIVVQKTEEEKFNELLSIVIGDLKEKGHSFASSELYKYFKGRDDFKPYRKKFTEMYNKHFVQFCSEEEVKSKFYKPAEILKLKIKHDSVMDTLRTNPKGLTEKDLCFYAYNRVKTEMVEEYLKKKNFEIKTNDSIEK